jgi:hypothetical protein
VDSGEDAAAEKYSDLFENQQDKFWFKDEEFEILARELYDAGMPDEALAYCKLAPNTSEIGKLTRIVQKSNK